MKLKLGLSLLFMLIAVLGVTLSVIRREAVVLGGPVVARVGGGVITPADVQQKLRERQRAHRFSGLTPADRNAALDDLIQFEALFARAQRAGWHTNAELVAAFRRSVVARFKEEEFGGRRESRPSDEEILRQYEQQAARFTRPEQSRGAVILVETPAKAAPGKRAEAETRANDVRAEAVRATAGQADFGHAARRHSIDHSTRYVGGDFGLLTAAELEGRYGAELARAVAALNSPGEVSPVVPTPRGFGFVKLIERRVASRRPLAEVRDAIAHEISRAKRAQAERDWLASAKGGVEIRINRALLDSIPLPDRTDDSPPHMPGSETAQLNP